MNAAQAFRTDTATGLQYHRDAELLMKANAFMGVVFLLIGGVLALLISLTRWPAVHLLPADWFYLTLTAHVADGIHQRLHALEFRLHARVHQRCGDDGPRSDSQHL